MSTGGSISNASNDVLFRQEDKDFHQVKSWSPTQQLVIKSIVPNFGNDKTIVKVRVLEKSIV